MKDSRDGILPAFKPTGSRLYYRRLYWKLYSYNSTTFKYLNSLCSLGVYERIENPVISSI